MIYWYHTLHATGFKIIHFPQLYTYTSASTISENTPGNLWRDILHCSRRSFLSLRCTLETAYFERMFIEKFALLPCTYYNMWNDFVRNFYKHWHVVLPNSFLLSTDANDYNSLTRIVCTNRALLGVFLPNNII